LAGTIAKAGKVGVITNWPAGMLGMTRGALDILKAVYRDKIAKGDTE
jgi:hypothetical protein